MVVGKFKRYYRNIRLGVLWGNFGKSIYVFKIYENCFKCDKLGYKIKECF